MAVLPTSSVIPFKTMHLQPSRTNDEQFWSFFDAQVEKVDSHASEADLPRDWWNMSLLNRAEALLAKIRGMADPVYAPKEIATLAIGALLVCNAKPKAFKAALHERIAALRSLVARKGRDYNAGGVSILEYWPLGAVNIIHEIRKRSLRLLSIGRTGQPPEFDDIGEIGLDIAAYSLFLLAYMDAAAQLDGQKQY